MDDKKTINKNIKTVLKMTHSKDFECYYISYCLLIFKANGKVHLLALDGGEKRFFIPSLMDSLKKENDLTRLFELVKKNYLEYDFENYKRELLDIKNDLENNERTFDENYFCFRWANHLSDDRCENRFIIIKYSKAFLLNLCMCYKTYVLYDSFLLVNQDGEHIIFSFDNMNKVKEIRFGNKYNISMNVRPNNIYRRMEYVIKNYYITSEFGDIKKYLIPRLW